ncbi:MAG: TetR/AcrR family transcriptional regulator [Cytophagaceae bacterium]
MKSIKVSIVLGVYYDMEIKHRITKAAEQMFLRFGVKVITMDQIARELGMSKKTIYQYFQDKNELVCEVLRGYMEKDDKCINEIIENASDPVDEVLRIADYLSSSLQNMNLAVLYEVQKYHPEAYNIYKEFKEKCIKNTLVENLKRGIEKGLYRKELNVEIISKLRMESVELGFNPTIFSPLKFTVQEIQVQFLDHFLHGICTLKGHKLINKYKQITEEE